MSMLFFFWACKVPSTVASKKKKPSKWTLSWVLVHTCLLTCQTFSLLINELPVKSVLGHIMGPNVENHFKIKDLFKICNKTSVRLTPFVFPQIPHLKNQWKQASLPSHLVPVCLISCLSVCVCGNCILHLSVWTINLNLCVQHRTKSTAAAACLLIHLLNHWNELTAYRILRGFFLLLTPSPPNIRLLRSVLQLCLISVCLTSSSPYKKWNCITVGKEIFPSG